MLIDEFRERVYLPARTVKIVLAILLVAAVAWWWKSDAPVTLGPEPTANHRVVILLHGSGGSKRSMKPLAEQLSRLAPNVSFILPSGPHIVGLLGRTWYPAFGAESRAAVNARMLTLRAEARAVVTQVIAELREDGIPPHQIYVGGFSQGATVALDVVLMSPPDVKLGGLVSLSGGALGLDLAPLQSRAPLRAFVSHGRSDEVLNFGKSKRIFKTLEQYEHEVEFVPFAGGHTVPPEVVRSLGLFLAAFAPR